MSTQKPSPETPAPLKNPGKTPGKERAEKAAEPPREIGGFADQNLPEPTRFGDWEVKGRCSDF